MKDGVIELSDHVVLLPNSDSSSNIRASLSSDSLLDDLLRNAQTCTHTHTCNRPSPDAAHTHTCLHTHTHLIPPEIDNNEESPVSKRRRPLGNREAVKRYRDKKKAHAAHLEEEVKKLRLVNQLLMGKLQKQSVLETEIVRLRALLFDLRGKIDVELGDFPFGNECNFAERECGVRENNLGCNFAGSSDVVNRRGETRGVDCEANLNYVSRG